MKRITFTFLMTSILLGSGQASAILIDFEDAVFLPDPDPLDELGPPVLSRGFHFESEGGSFADVHLLMEDGTTVLTSHFEVTMTQENGAAFSIFGFDFAGDTGFGEPGERPFTVYGELVGGGSIEANFTPDGVGDGPGGVEDFETFLFSLNWTNLESVTWVHYYPAGGMTLGYRLDNIVVSPIPEPATITLFGLGLVGFAARRRKAKS